MSSTSSRKIKIAIPALVGGLGVIIAIVFMLSFYSQNSLISNASPDQNLGGSFTVIRCNDVLPATSILETNGFVTIKPRTSATPELTPGVPTSGNEPGIYEFVLKPGSTGIVTMSYDFCAGKGESVVNSSDNKTTSGELKIFFDSFNSTNKGIDKLNAEAFSSSDNTPKDPLSSLMTKNNVLPTTHISHANETGVDIRTSNITRTSDHAVKVTYVISADPSSNKATYIITNFFRTCPGELLTIGDEPNEKSAEWAKGPFYGCVG
ncbi:hypothetical protein NTE_03008 [Candidatus Nitrososphaera evergladensis SR1]|uniref:Uncharacterized protein n=1 Tax=Candidatus Nitrososphaera evergladensis SR1 TaxID=1459636 RepID=A0A075MV57_9ARCH|nr:hypothetical protein NTE_03008 [Candidatus Nitrososphaera evergladensis SR1]